MAKIGTTGVFTYFLSRLRYPQLFTLAAVLFLVDLVLPDVVPFIDEILLGALTLLLGSLRNRAEAPEEAPRVEKNVTPPGER
ncbi:MAG: hypothetical protein KDD11_10430 [Acidobacteria bacterium]|nr:hypothetical protein [Acidobacteriota bacterium]